MAHQSHNIHGGTQIVTKLGVHGSNNALVHPRGAVGIVTRTPCGHEQHFLVRFPDGFEASLLREELEVLKLFKDRLDPADAQVWMKARKRANGRACRGIKISPRR